MHLIKGCLNTNINLKYQAAHQSKINYSSSKDQDNFMFEFFGETLI
jgi:hypothetical protein